MSSELEKVKAKARTLVKKKDWGRSYDAYARLADELRRQHGRRVALRYYFAKGIISLQGGTSVFAAEGAEADRSRAREFKPDFSFLGSDVVQEATMYLTEGDGDWGTLKDIYAEAQEEVWQDRFPRSAEGIWSELSDRIARRAEKGQLRERVG